MRHVILHYHLFKNAGMTIDGILDRQLAPEEHGFIEGDKPWTTVSPEQLLEFAVGNPGLRAISSHQARLPMPVHPSITFVPILFLRHPIDRFASVYEFERRQSPDSLSPSVAVAQKGGLDAFAEWTISRESTATCRNFQVIHLAGALEDMRMARATHAEFKLALSRLDSLPCFGIVDQFEASLEWIFRVAGAALNSTDANYVSQNVTPGREATLGKRIESIENALSPELYRALLECNALDMLLYEEAKALFKQRCKAAPEAPSSSSMSPASDARGFGRQLFNMIRGR